jgi:hypothetical protein
VWLNLRPDSLSATSRSDHDRVLKRLQSTTDPPAKCQYFVGKAIIFVGDVLRFPSVMPNYAVPVIPRLIAYSAYRAFIPKFRLLQPMRARNPRWAKFLNSIVTGNLPEASWPATQSRVTFRVHSELQSLRI